jgi:hypothetical protein
MKRRGKLRDEEPKEGDPNCNRPETGGTQTGICKFQLLYLPGHVIHCACNLTEGKSRIEVISSVRRNISPPSSGSRNKPSKKGVPTCYLVSFWFLA